MRELDTPHQNSLEAVERGVKFRTFWGADGSIFVGHEFRVVRREAFVVAGAVRSAEHVGVRVGVFESSHLLGRNGTIRLAKLRAVLFSSENEDDGENERDEEEESKCDPEYNNAGSFLMSDAIETK